MPHRYTFDFVTSNNSGWAKTDPYSDKIVDVIKVKLTPTEMPRVAVPSPFARFELMQKAFHNVADKGKGADVRDLRLVSNSLDILQLVFEGISDPNLIVIDWDLEKKTSEMIKTGEGLGEDKPGLKLYGETLRDYSKREKYGLNGIDFSSNQNLELFILAYDGRYPLAMTCPTCLFLPTPDYENELWGEKFKLQGNIPLFSTDRHLFDRDPAFVKYVIALVDSWIKEFGKNNIPDPIKDFVNYVEKQALNVDGLILRQAESIADQGINSEYDEALIDNVKINVLGLDLYRIKKSAEEDFIRKSSSLVIRPTDIEHSSDYNDGKKALPLVLSNNITAKDLVYTSAGTYWDSKDSKLDYSDLEIKSKMPWERKKLPNGKEYSGGFLYDHDLLSDQLWMLPYNLNDDKFEKAWANEGDGYSFLPPVKDIYFKYFTLEDLMNNLKLEVKAATLPNGRKKIINVTARLSIDIRGTRKEKKLELKKVYHNSDSLESALDIETIGESNPDMAQGALMNVRIALTIFPFIRFENEKLDNYALMLAREPELTSSRHHEMGLEVYGPKRDENGYVKIDKVSKAVRRIQDDEHTVQTYSVEKNEIAYFKIKLDKSEAILIPKWSSPYRGGSNGLNFAFDFGTSNSYVAVSDIPEKENPKLKITLPTTKDYLVSTISEDPGIPSNNTMLQSFNDYVNQDMLPSQKNRTEKPFPMRSVLSAPKKNLDENDKYHLPFLKSSIPFLLGYEDYGMMHNRLITNLKWLAEKIKKNENNNDKERVAAYINELMWIAQLYAVSQGALLDKCSIIWTYPISMSKNQISSFQSYWLAAYSKYFDPNIDPDLSMGSNNVKRLPESVAPMIKLKGLKGNNLPGMGITIDIGGGTCDVVIYNGLEEEGWKIASFKFGAEVIFGIDQDVEMVPMIKNGLDEIASTIEKYAKSTKSESLIKNIAKNLRDSAPRMQDVTSALFALEEQPLLEEIVKSISFNKYLRNHDEYHYLIYFYYGAIIYYICRLIENINKKDSSRRRTSRLETIFFSGSGSKILNIIADNVEELSNITEDMIKFFSNNEIKPKNFEIEMSSEPKEVTAKGALRATDKDIQRFSAKNKNAAKKYEVKYFMIEEIDNKILEDDEEDNEDIEFTKGELFKANNLKSLVNSVVEYLNLYSRYLNKFVEEEIAESAEPFLESLKDGDKWDKEYIEDIIISIFNYKDDEYEIADTPFFAVLEKLIFDQLKRRR